MNFFVLVWFVHNRGGICTGIESKSTYTTQKISDNIDEAWLIVSKYLINDKNYKQAEIYRDQIYDLAEDASRYTELLINFNSKYKITISSNKLNIKSAIFTNELNDLKSNVNNLKLKDRHWTCENCHTYHDRDVNAAINLENCYDYTVLTTV